ncbi:M48 family metallopeptidase [uncultured Algimonas sp.]|uniref:M48 family metallopeptidase n=1 Tax=uncultured Algimonas sp. TaxID=1547920 RepID=UPI0026296540|nr:M48 family metallopeptidase [uncultured Algimonas sp.]
MCTTHQTPANEAVAAADPQLMFRRKFLKYAGVAGAATAAGGLASCTTNPVTGRSQLLAFAPSEADLARAAQQSWNEVRRQTPTTNDPRYAGRLRNIGSRVSRGAGQANRNWDYAVFDQNTKNAFVLPGNRVGFFKGMMDFTDNDDQIAAIMGHEVGHVTGAHARERYSQMMLGQLAIAGGTMLAGSQLQRRCRQARSQRERNDCMRSAGRNTQYLQAALGMGFQLGVVLPYGRRQELESDQLGARYMARAGYDPYQAVRLWEKMGAESGGSRGPEFLATHPTPERRARELSDYITAQQKLGSRGFQQLDIPADA